MVLFTLQFCVNTAPSSSMSKSIVLVWRLGVNCHVQHLERRLSAVAPVFPDQSLLTPNRRSYVAAVCLLYKFIASQGTVCHVICPCL